MRSPKTPKFADYNARANCFSPHQLHDNTVDEWLDGAQLMLEVGAGTAKVSLEYARQHPEAQVIAIDQKADRLVKAARVAEGEGLDNIAFIHSDLRRLDEIIDLSGKVAHIWVTFPDPYPKDRHEKNRLTYPKMLSIYANYLQPNGILEFKTDNKDLYDYSLQQMEESDVFALEARVEDLHGSSVDDPVALAKTSYEQKFLGEGLTTKYLRATKIAK